MAESEDVILRLKLQDRAAFAAGLREAASQIHQVETSTRRANTATAEGEDHWNRWGSVSRIAAGASLSYALYGIVTAVESVTQSVIVGGIQWNAFQESSQTAFKFILGDAGRAHTLLSDLQKLNLHTSFQLPQLEQAAQQLLAVGFSARELVPTLRTLADLAAVNPLLGGEGLDRIAVVFGQIRSTGRLMAQDALQLTSLGIPVWQILADKFHKSKEQIRKDSEAGLISGTTAINAILAYSTQRYKGAADEQSRNFTGLMSNLTDELHQAEGTLLMPFMAPLEKNLSGLNATLTAPGFQRGLQTLSHHVHDTAIDLVGITKNTAILTSDLSGLDGNGGVAALGAIATDLHIINVVLDFIVGGMRNVTGVFGSAFTSIGNFVEIFRATNLVLTHTHDALILLKDPLDYLMEALGWLHDNAEIAIHVAYHGPGSGLFGDIKGGIGGLVPSLPSFPFQAEGGITTSPGWSWVGEKGPELRWMDKGATVMPLDRISRNPDTAPAAGGDLHVHLSLDGRDLTTVVLENIDEMRSRR